MAQTDAPTLKRGYFAVRISVDDRQGTDARAMVERFIGQESQRYALQTLTPVTTHAENGGGTDTSPHAEAVIAVPFPEKENLRVDFNIFAAEAEDDCGDAQRFYFYMESAM